MLMSRDCAATGGYVDVHELCYRLKPCWRLWSMLPSGIMVVSMTTHSETEGRVDVCSPCYHWKPWGCPWFVLSPESMLMSMACAVARNHVESYDPGCRSLIRGKEAFCCGVDDWRLTVEMRGIGGFSDNPSFLPLHPPQRRNNLDQKPVKRMLWWFLVGVGVGKDSVFLKGVTTKDLTMLQWIYWQHKLDLVFFSSLFFFLLFGFEGGYKVWGQGYPGRTWKWMWSGCLT